MPVADARTQLAGLVLAVALGGWSACERTTDYPQGAILYENYCANCHQPSGQGLVGNIPPLAGADWLHTQRDSILCVLRWGMRGPLVVNGLPYEGVMQGHPRLSDTELLNIANYVLTSWGNAEAPIKATEAKRMLSGCGRERAVRVQ